MIEGNKVSELLPKSWRKSFHSEIVISTKKRFCIECNDKRVCNKCNIQLNENKEFEANLNLSEWQPPNQFDRMLPYYQL